MTRPDATTRRWMTGPADEHAVAAGCTFNLHRAERVREFFSTFLRHTKGEYAGKPFQLLDWQWKRIIGPLFGWERPDGTRRFREAYIEVPKKNGKSELCGGIGDYMLVGDGEYGAEVYIAAADRAQAGIVYGVASDMIRKHPSLRERCMVTPSVKTIGFPEQNSVLKALSAEAPTKEGLNWHCLIFDELHAQPDRKLWNALQYGGIARREPLLVSITTAGYDRLSICWTKHEYALAVQAGVIEDWEFLGVVYAAPEKGSWTSPATWRKCNPSIGVTIHEHDLERQCKIAQADPLEENTFKRYRLNIWTQQAVRWIQMAHWDACGSEPVEEGPCYGGLDLADKNDLAAFALYWPETHSARVWFWLPEDLPSPRDNRVKDQLRAWGANGHIELTPGNVIDYAYIRQRIREEAARVNLADIGYDPARATQLAIQLQDEDGIAVVEYPQSYTKANEACVELKGLITSHTLRHGGNPVLAWNASNVVVTPNSDGHIKINKGKSSDKVDGMTALVMAMGRAMSQRTASTRSVYDERGVIAL